MTIGVHLVADLFGCPPELLEQAETVRDILHRVAEKAELHVVGEAIHQFEPVGATGILLLAESHLSIHTWPERGLVAADIFTCGPEEVMRRAFDALCDELRPSRSVHRLVRR